MTRGAGMTVALLLLAIAAAAWWAFGSPAWSVATRDERATERADSTAPRVVQIEPRTTGEAPGLAPAPRSASPRAPKAGARIHGRVTVAGSEAPPPEGSRVDVRVRIGEERPDGYRSKLLHRGPLDPTGRYEVRLGAEALPEPRELTVLAAIPGRAYVQRTIQAGPDDDVQVDLVSGAEGREGAFRGHVHDEAGRPVPGLRLVIQSSEAYRDDEAKPVDPESGAPEGPDTALVEGVVTTGPDGRFAMDGLLGSEGTEYGVASLDDAWLVRYAPSPPARADSGEAALVATRAFVLEGLVTDAETGEALESIRRTQRIRVNGEFRASSSEVGNVNPFWWQAGIPPGGESGFDVVFDAEAVGYRSARRTVRFEPGRWAQRLEMALERPRYERGDLGRLRLLHEIRDETGRPAALGATLWEVDADGGRNKRAAPVTSGDDGFGMVELPTGPAEVEFVVLWWGGYPGPLRWRGNVDVVGATTTDFRVQFPSAGALRVHPAETAAGMRRLVLIGPGSDPRGPLSSVRVRGSARTVFFPGVPIGPWQIRFHDAAPQSTVTVDVAEGRVTEAVLPK